MPAEFDEKLNTYADLAIKVGVNLQPGQPLVIRAYGEVEYLAPLVRKCSASAYKAGAKYVDVLWFDDELSLIRFQHAPRDSFEEYPRWQVEGIVDLFTDGGASLAIIGADPDLLAEQDTELIATARQTAAKLTKPMYDFIIKDKVNWSGIAAATPVWAAKVFADNSPEAQVDALWEAIFEFCRLNETDPIAAWGTHNHNLEIKSEFLTEKQYQAIHLKGPGTDLSIGLPENHVWKGGQALCQAGFYFNPNLPTEEIFTAPHKNYTHGTVHATKPLSLMGTLIEDFSLTFKDGKVVDIQAKRGETILRKAVETDEGAHRLGELALVPHSSPISQSGRLFYNTLFDENAACHIALGDAYTSSIKGGDKMTDEEFSEAGGNQSLMHIDFMIGSDEVDIDGIAGDGSIEPIFRNGEWAV